MPFPRIVVDGGLLRVAGEGRAPAEPEGGQRVRVAREFVPGEKPDFVHLLGRALRLDVEPADRVDLVVHEVETEGALGPHREDVDDPAPHRELTRGQNLAHVGVARGGEVGLQFVDRDLVPGLQRNVFAPTQETGRAAARR